MVFSGMGLKALTPVYEKLFSRLVLITLKSNLFSIPKLSFTIA